MPFLKRVLLIFGKLFKFFNIFLFNLIVIITKFFIFICFYNIIKHFSDYKQKSKKSMKSFTFF